MPFSNPDIHKLDGIVDNTNMSWACMLYFIFIFNKGSLERTISLKNMFYVCACMLCICVGTNFGDLTTKKKGFIYMRSFT